MQNPGKSQANQDGLATQSESVAHMPEVNPTESEKIGFCIHQVAIRLVRVTQFLPPALEKSQVSQPGC